MTQQQATQLLEDSRLKISTVAAMLILLLSNATGVMWLVWKTEIRLAALEKETARLDIAKRDKGVASWNRAAMITWVNDAEGCTGLELPDPQSLRYSSSD